jgi:hypothetical protein
MHFSLLHYIARNRTGTAKLKARCFSHPALIGEAIRTKGSIINMSDFFFDTVIHLVIS